jgi:FkbM family methyltransferase
MVEGKRRSGIQTLADAAPGFISAELALLGAQNGAVVEFIEMETGSSVCEERSHYNRRKVLKVTKTLDDLLTERHAPAVDLLKLDVQGYELEVLKGASGALAQSTAMLLEASLIRINSGCPPISEVMSYADTAGFRLFDFSSQIRRKDRILWQTDLLFIRSNSRLLPLPSLTAENW